MPQVPPVPRTAALTSDDGASALPPDETPLPGAIDRVFAEGGALARVLPAYEPREGQRRMAAAVASLIERGGTLLAEAGTGTGKTLAYLAPAILSGRRVLVSTGTKNLQEQVFLKDLPLLAEALGARVTATLMKGRGNYLCRHRWDLYRERMDGQGGSLIDTGERIVLSVIGDWLRTTTTGDRAELRQLPEDLPVWRQIAAEAESCLGTECAHYDTCFVTEMRRQAAESDVVIVNHHLLCADAAVRHGAYGEVIPACSTLVVDEAHQLEDVATQYFGCSVSAWRIEDLVRDLERLLAAPGAPGLRETEGVLAACARAADLSRRFFAGLAVGPAARTAGAEARLRYDAEALAGCADEGEALARALDDLKDALSSARPPVPPGGDAAEPLDAAARVSAGDGMAALERRAGEIAGDLRFLVRADDADYVYFVEARGRSARGPAADAAGQRAGLVLRASPIDVSRIVQEALFDRMRATVLTSATLAVDGSFDYVKGRLGIARAEELLVPSEFDFARQALLYLPRRMPPPRAPSFADAAAREIVQIVTRSRGRAFVLFTSYGVLRAVQPLVQMALPYPILVQGTAPRTELIDRFRRTPHAVLLATSSFWQGVDVVGEALSCVVVDKLPFASPGDPVTAARIEAIDARGGDAFSEYQVPLAILALQQGLGRLLRHRSDRGVLAVLDPRLRTMAYGRRFLASLPPAPVTDDLDAVGRFFM